MSPARARTQTACSGVKRTNHEATVPPTTQEGGYLLTKVNAGRLHPEVQPFTLLYTIFAENLGGAMASWLVHSTPERVVRLRALAGDIVLCSWARHFTLTVPLSTQVYKWVPANLMLGVNPAMD